MPSMIHYAKKHGTIKTLLMKTEEIARRDPEGAQWWDRVHADNAKKVAIDVNCVRCLDKGEVDGQFCSCELGGEMADDEQEWLKKINEPV